MSTTESWLWIDEYHSATVARQPTVDDTEGGGDDLRPNPRRDGGRSLRRVCDGATPNTLPTETARRLEKYGYGNYRRRDRRRRSRDGRRDDGVKAALPTFLHHCQSYKFANHTFAKRKVPHDFFRCDGPPLPFDAPALVLELDAIEDDAALSPNDRITRTRTGFMLCHLIPLMNMALIDYKQDLCGKEP